MSIYVSALNHIMKVGRCCHARSKVYWTVAEYSHLMVFIWEACDFTVSQSRAGRGYRQFRISLNLIDMIACEVVAHH